MSSQKRISFLCFPGIILTLFSLTSPVMSDTHFQIKPCPSTPNCVSSLAKDEDYYIDPLTSQQPISELWLSLKSVLSSMSRMEVVKETTDYLHVEATSLIFRFVDDVEFVLDKQNQLIHVRSASRVGRSDFGVNRQRIENIRQQLNENQNSR